MEATYIKKIVENVPRWRPNPPLVDSSKPNSPACTYVLSLLISVEDCKWAISFRDWVEFSVLATLVSAMVLETRQTEGQTK